MDAAAAPIFDNPSLGRELRTGVRPGRMGVLLLIHAAALLLGLYVASWLGAWGEFHRDLSPYVDFGRALLGILAGIECAVVTLYVPFRAGLVLYGETRNKCLDQVAASGLSPLSMAWGHLAATLGSVALLLCSGLPYFALCPILGNVTLGEVAGVLAMILCYSLALGCVALALGMLQHFGAALVLVPAMAIAAGLAFIPDSECMPTLVAAIVPSRALLFTVFGRVPEFARAFRLPTIAGVVVPCWLLSCAYFAAVSAVAWGYLLAGPDVWLAPGLSDFDAITLGVRKGKRGSRLRGRLLIRKIQLAFLYENRPRWLKRISTRLRQALFALIATAAFVAIAAAVLPEMNPSVWRTRQGWALDMDWANDGALCFYAVVTAIWAAVLLPSAHRRIRDRVSETVAFGCSARFGQPTFWHVILLLMPAVVFVGMTRLVGKPGTLAVAGAGNLVGFWLMASCYSLAAGALVSVSCARARYPGTRNLIAVAILVGLVVVPFIWYPFYLFGLVPGQMCYVCLVSLPVGLTVAADPWDKLDFGRFVGHTVRLQVEWGWILLFHACAAAATMYWNSRVVRRLRSHEEAEHARGAAAGAAD